MPMDRPINIHQTLQVAPLINLMAIISNADMNMEKY